MKTTLFEGTLLEALGALKVASRLESGNERPGCSHSFMLLGPEGGTYEPSTRIITMLTLEQFMSGKWSVIEEDYEDDIDDVPDEELVDHLFSANPPLVNGR